MMGGYSPADANSKEVMTAAELVVNSLRHGQGPIENYSFAFPMGEQGNFDVKILDASKQVSVPPSTRTLL